MVPQPIAAFRRLAVDTVVLRLSDKVRFVPGCVYGLTQPFWAIASTVESGIAAGDWNATVRAITQVLPTLPMPAASAADSTPDDAHLAALRSFVAWVQALHELAGLGFVEAGKVLRLGAGELPFLLLLPTAAPAKQAGLRVIRALVRCLASGADKSSVAGLQAGLDALGAAMPGGFGLPQYLRHAVALGIPFDPIADAVVQFGQGSRGRWLANGMTEETAAISVGLAKSKSRSLAMLRAQGLPTPEHHRVDSAERALAAARALGMPVVVKPEDRDRGAGVTTAIDTEDEVRQAFDHARAESAIVLVERHLPGRDYRLAVIGGEMVWAIERVPASVLGDGVNSVRELMAQANADPLRGTERRCRYRPLKLDAEALRLLDKQGLQPDAVPTAGRRVRLHLAANVATGGWPVNVTDQVHPDNRDLAVTAASTLRLDVAGIDLLIEDISRSWRETGAGICEVNAPPGFDVLTGDHLYRHMLLHLLDDGARIPSVVLVGVPSDSGVVQALVDAVTSAGLRVGVAEGSDLRVGGTRLRAPDGSAFAACRALLRHRRVDCLVQLITDPNVVATGLPLDQIDVLVCGANPNADADANALLSFFRAGRVGTLVPLNSSSPTAATALAQQVAPLLLARFREAGKRQPPARTA